MFLFTQLSGVNGASLGDPLVAPVTGVHIEPSQLGSCYSAT